MGKIFNKLSYALIITAIIGLGISYGKLYLFHIALLTYGIIGLFSLKTYKNELLKVINEPPYLILIIIILWYLLSTVWSGHKVSALIYTIYWIFGALIIFSFRIPDKDIIENKKIFKIISIIVFVELVICFLEGFTSFRFPISPYFDNVSLFGREISYDINLSPEIIKDLKSTPTGFRWNPNDLATMMVLIIPFFVFHKNIFYKFIGSFAAIGVITLTGSRAAFFALFILGIIFAILYTRRSEIRKNLKLLSIIIVIAFAAFMIVKQYTNHKFSNLLTTWDAAKIYVTESHENVNPYSSISIRQNLIKNGMKGFIETKGLGVGGGNSKYIGLEKGMAFTNNITSLHNFWIEILVEGGVIIFILFMGWYFWIFWKLYKIARKTLNNDLYYFANAGSLAMIGFFIAAISMSSAIYFLPMWVLFGVNLSTINNFKKQNLVL